jgi:ferrous iron transport protein B
MPPSPETRDFTVALIGNPNTGKSTLFSGLVGVHQHVGNYPGVTVEKKTGDMEVAGRPFELIDLPGLYSLAPRSRDEMVAVDLLVGRQQGESPVDAVICIVDAGNLLRNLYLVSQVLELGLPTIVAVNMLDVAESRGVRIDIAKLERHLGVPVAPIQANKRIGFEPLKAVLADLAAGNSPRKNIPGCQAQQAGLDPKTALPCSCTRCGFWNPPDEKEQEPTEQPHFSTTPLPESFEKAVSELKSELDSRIETTPPPPLPCCLVRRLLLDMNGYLLRTLLEDPDGHWGRRIEELRSRLAAEGHPVPAVETSARYDWARRMMQGAVLEPGNFEMTATDHIDHVLTHRLWGTLIFAVVMLVVFQSVFVGAKPATEWIQSLTAHAGQWVTTQMAEGALRSLLVNGIIGGVGSILAFLPQILILFGFLALLEDCGYMARTAFLMDRLMVRVGLSGKSFIPLLSSFACAVPGIMATRVIENERDRLTTILVAPLLTCSARLPIYAMLIAAFIPAQSYFGNLLTLQGLTLGGLYLLGIVMAVLCALIFKRTIFRGQTPPFIMELPSYKWPSPRTVIFRMAERGWVFVRCAGTLILAASILVWAALYFPHDPEATHQQQQQNSFLGRAGQVIEPVVKPLGWDWRIGCAVIASLPAREIVVATLGVMYHIDDEQQTDSEGGSAEWSKKLHSVKWDGTDQPVYNIPVALSIMVFFALCAQCMATLAVIRRETNSWRWPAFTFAYMTVLAYLGALATYQIGMCIS